MIKKAFFILQLIFFNCIIFGQESQIALELQTSRGSVTIYVESDTKELFFEKSFVKVVSDTKELFFEKSSIESIPYIESIRGLDKLQNLETIIFDMTGFITDFSFLEDVTCLKKLVFVLVRPNDWKFIEKLTCIEKLYIRSCNIKDIRLDLINNTELRYLEISNGSLDSYPELMNIPPAFEYLNLSYNKIKFVPENKKYQSSFITILFQNREIEYFESKFILFVEPESVLPAQYIINNVSH
jgi:hypothetical protein